MLLVGGWRRAMFACLRRVVESPPRAPYDTNNWRAESRELWLRLSSRWPGRIVLRLMPRWPTGRSRPPEVQPRPGRPFPAVSPRPAPTAAPPGLPARAGKPSMSSQAGWAASPALIVVLCGLLASAAPAQAVGITDITFSGPGTDNLYTSGETLDITVTYRGQCRHGEVQR